jgi:transcriptional regulator with XRE-family HTH domain
VEQTSREFLRALRGRRSQVQWARRLGYKGNPITDWERGDRFPTMAEALRAAALSGVDVLAATARFTPAVPLQRSGAELALAEWLSALRGSTSLAELAASSGFSRFAVSRWLRGRAQPRVPEFFRLLDAITGRLPEWLAELVDIAAVPSLVPRFRAIHAAKHLAFEAPWTEAVLRLLETQTYLALAGHEPGFIATRLGIPLAEEERCLDRLLQAEIIVRRRHKYVARDRRSTVDTRGGARALHNLKRHWTQVAAERLAAPRSEDFFAYNVISLSHADLERVREKLRVTFRELRALVAASEPEEVAALINLQVVTFLEPETAPAQSP